MPKLNENEGNSGGGHNKHGVDNAGDIDIYNDDDDEDDDDDDEDEDDEESLLAAALAMSVSAHADPGFFPQKHTGYRTETPEQPYSFVTEVVICSRRPNVASVLLFSSCVLL